MSDQEFSCSEVEFLDCCPVCGGAGDVLYDDIEDFYYHAIAGQWCMNSCRGCRSAYLSPRPTKAAIHKAYANYATHDRVERLPPEALGGLRKIQRILANGYKNAKFGTKYRPSSVLGVLVAAVMPEKRALMDREFRHLTKSHGRVLDIGFGDGGFMLNAQDMGWDAVGIDADPCVVSQARLIGLNVYLGRLEELPTDAGNFDAITLNHVIEHVHDPIGVLAQCYRLLNPGGMLWIETPNITSLGHAHFGKFWRGLEAPRHLVLFNPESLKIALKASGFDTIEHFRQTDIDLWQVSESARLAKVCATQHPMWRFNLLRAFARIRSRFSPEYKEFIAIRAFKEMR